MKGPTRRALGALAVAGALGAGAQEPFFMDSATHPSRGLSAVRMLGVSGSRRDGSDGVGLRLRAAHGLRADLALLGEWGGRWGSDGEEMDGAALRLKHRFWRRDLGPVDTLRASVLVGVERAAGAGRAAEGRGRPRGGAVVTGIHGRHGWNAGAGIRAARRPEGEARLDGSYLFRLHPARYGPDTRGSLYAVSEWNAGIRRGSDAEVLWTGGLLWEAWRWAAELGGRSPLRRGGGPEDERGWGFVAGLRTLF